MIQIISHRGFWKDSKLKNSEEAFNLSIAHHFGIETDLRDYKGEVVIAHDSPSGNEITLDDFFKLKGIQKVPLALNIKSDGLAKIVAQKIEKYDISNYFTFDMSFPDHRGYCREQLRNFYGINEFYPFPPQVNDPYDGIWLDSFQGDWFGPSFVSKLLNSYKNTCIVSPELHGRNHKWQWQMIKEFNLQLNKGLMICTDFPDQAHSFFIGD